MAKTPEERREAARRRKANQRARLAGEVEPYKVSEEEKASKKLREEQYHLDLAWAQEQDRTGKFYAAECRTAEQLLRIYYGTKEECEDEEEESAKKKAVQQNRPNPSVQPVRIPASYAITEGGELVEIDPDNPEYRGVFEVCRVLTFKEWLDYRDKGRHDLFWLSGLLDKRLFHKTHHMVCDMFVRKDFTGKFYQGFDRHTVSDAIRDQKRFAADGTPTRTAMIFAPRGGWKSTIDGIDAVQWMLNAPDIRIMIITAFRNLSRQFLKEIKTYFYLSPRGEATNFQILYPEYVLTGVAGRSREPLECPAAVLKSKEPHLWVTSMESSITGQRADICKADDIVDPKNSTEEEMRQSLIDKFNGALNLTEPWGFVDIIGTRYFTDDYYGTRMQPDDEGVVAPFALLSISGWYPKQGFETLYQRLLELPNGMSQVTEEMVDLWFPFKLDFATLRRKLLETKERNSSNIQKKRNFRNQYLNIATDPAETADFAVHFDRESLRAHTYMSTAAPQTGETIVTVDWAYSDNKGSDFSVIAAIRRHVRDDGTQELIVLDVDYDKWKATTLAEKIVLFLRKHQPTRTFIEKALGADMLYGYILTCAQRYQVALTGVQFVPTGNSQNEKANRIKTLEILLSNDRLHFVSGPWIDELYRQFERFTGETKKGRKDDIPDSISIASRTLPQEMFTAVRHTTPEEDKRTAEEFEKQSRKAHHYQQYFGNGRTNFGTKSYTKSVPGLPNSPAPTWKQWLRGENPDAAPPEPQITEVKPQDPRMIIFGNKGPWRL
jgi:hypothetical protein